MCACMHMALVYGTCIPYTSSSLCIHALIMSIPTTLARFLFRNLFTETCFRSFDKNLFTWYRPRFGVQQQMFLVLSISRILARDLRVLVCPTVLPPTHGKVCSKKLTARQSVLGNIYRTGFDYSIMEPDNHFFTDDARWSVDFIWTHSLYQRNLKKSSVATEVTKVYSIYRRWGSVTRKMSS